VAIRSIPVDWRSYRIPLYALNAPGLVDGSWA
jgi:hypothetical protein